MSSVKLEAALVYLNKLIIRLSREFPDACWDASERFEVDYVALADAYDAQFAE